MGKKIRKAMEEERERFTSGMESMGYEAKLGVQVFDVIAQFADYAFNKSHSYGYGLIAYQTAYLKTHYPVQYMAALMTSVKGRKKEDSAIYLNECRLMGLNVVVPGINQAGMNYYPDLGMETNDQAIIYGLSAIRNVGEGIVTLLLEERNMNGPFEDFYDFCSRVDMQVLNRRAIEALIKAGSFDSMGHPRQGLLAVYERIVEQTVSRRRERDMGVMTLFESAPEESSDVFDEKIVIPDLEFEKPQRLAFEKEMLGRYISDHPLNGYEGTIRRKCDVSTTGLGHQEEGKVVKVGGVISELNKKYTTRGDLMANISLEDLEGSVEIIVFTKVMSQIGHKLINDQPVIITGRVDRRDEILKLVCMDVETLKSDEETKISSIEVQIPSTGTTTKHLENLASLLNEHPGECDVYVWIGSKKIWLGSEVRVNPDNGLMGELRVLLGADSIL